MHKFGAKDDAQNFLAKTKQSTLLYYEIMATILYYNTIRWHSQTRAKGDFTTVLLLADYHKNIKLKRLTCHIVCASPNVNKWAEQNNAHYMLLLSGRGCSESLRTLMYYAHDNCMACLLMWWRQTVRPKCYSLPHKITLKLKYVLGKFLVVCLDEWILIEAFCCWVCLIQTCF